MLSKRALVLSALLLKSTNKNFTEVYNYQVLVETLIELPSKSNELPVMLFVQASDAFCWS